MVTFTKHYDFNLRRDHQKISYERRAYELVDERAYITSYVPKNEIKNLGGLRLKEMRICAFV